ncbi:hypothetical protein B0H13DRAFT_2379988, partial [Mycena leptocephala]
MSAPLETQGPRTVSQLCEVPTALRLLLPPFLLRIPDLGFYGGKPDGLLRYFVEVVGPYARLLTKASRRALPVPPTFPIPPRFSCCRTCQSFVIPWFGARNCYTDRDFDWSRGSHPAGDIRTLVLMRKFHIFLGQPSYDLGNRNQDTLFRLLGDMLDSARSVRKDSEDPLDIPYSRGLEHVPCVPSWSANEILLLRAQETVDPWVGEKYWVRECIQDASQLGKDLARMLAQVEGVDWYPDLPVALGLSRTHQDTDPSAVSEYYVPSFATLTFFMMEWFVNLIGFDGDEDVSTWESVFAALDALQHAMIVHSDYYHVPLNAPGFTFDSVDPYDYGVGRHTKDLQIHETSALLDTVFPSVLLNTISFVLVPTPQLILWSGNSFRPSAESCLDLRVIEYLCPLVASFLFPLGNLSSQIAVLRSARLSYDGAESLLGLSLDRATLLSDFYIPPEGYPRFWQYRLHAFVHGIMRAATHDFQFLNFLPSYPLAEHRKLCSWVEVLLWHLRLVVKTIDHRRSCLARNEIAWAAVDVTIPGEAFHMLQLVSFLCHFVGYTNGDDSVESLRPTILLPLIGASSKQIIMTGCRGEYPEYDRNGSDVQSSLQVLTAPMGVTEEETTEEEEVEEDELDAPARSSAPAPLRKSKGGNPAPISSSSAVSVPIPRSFRERLATSRLVNIPRAPPQFTVEFLEAEVAKLAHHVEKLGPRLAGLEAPDWEPNLLPTIPPFEDSDAVAVNIPAELPSLAPISEQRARLEEICRLQKEADVLHEEHLNSMTARENFEEWCQEEQPARFWKDVAVQERTHADRVCRRDANNFKRANEPARIHDRFERTNALYEDYKGRLEE